MQHKAYFVVFLPDILKLTSRWSKLYPFRMAGPRMNSKNVFLRKINANYVKMIHYVFFKNTQISEVIRTLISKVLRGFVYTIFLILFCLSTLPPIIPQDLWGLDKSWYNVEEDNMPEIFVMPHPVLECLSDLDPMF